MDHGDQDRPSIVLDGPTRSGAPGRADGTPSPDAAGPALQTILDDAVSEVPGADAGWVAVLRDGVVALPAVSHPDIEKVTRGWADCAEGPCVDAMRSGRTRTIALSDLAVEAPARWPRYAATVGRLGMGSVLSFVMTPPDAAPTAVTFGAGAPSALTERSRAVGGVFAMQVAVALHGPRRVGGLLETLKTRDVVGRATGILMERFGLDDEQAYSMLVSSSQDTNTPLLDVATWLADQGKPRLA